MPRGPEGDTRDQEITGRSARGSREAAGATLEAGRVLGRPAGVITGGWWPVRPSYPGPTDAKRPKEVAGSVRISPSRVFAGAGRIREVRERGSSPERDERWPRPLMAEGGARPSASFGRDLGSVGPLSGDCLAAGETGNDGEHGKREMAGWLVFGRARTRESLEVGGNPGVRSGSRLCSSRETGIRIQRRSRSREVGRREATGHEPFARDWWRADYPRDHLAGEGARSRGKRKQARELHREALGGRPGLHWAVLGRSLGVRKTVGS